MAEAVMYSEGARIDHTPSGAVAVGQVIPLTNLCGVATEAIADATLGSIAIEGVFTVAKTGGSGGETHSVGEKLYWDDSSNVATDTNTSGVYPLGICVEAAAATATTVKVKLFPV